MEQKSLNKVIIQPNKFSRAEYSFDLVQRNGIQIIQQQINKDSPIQKEWELSKEDFANFLGINLRGMKMEWDKSLVDKFQKTTIVIEIEKGHHKGISLFDAEFIEGTETLKLTIQDNALFIFFPFKFREIEKEPEKNFTKIESQALKKLNSPIYKKLYELLSSYHEGASKEKPLYIELKDLRLQLGVSESHDAIVKDGLFTFKVKDIVDVKYKEWGQLNTVLKRAIKSINNLDVSNIKNLSFNVIKKKRKVIGLEFVFFNTNRIKNEIINSIISNVGLTKTQTLKLFSIYGKNTINEINTRFKKATISVHNNPHYKGTVYHNKIDNKIIRNKTAFIVSLFKEELNS